MPTGRITVAVIGNGIIGHGISQVFAAAGHPVIMIGRDPANVAKAVDNIRASLAEFAAHRLLSDQPDAVLGRIRTSVRLADAAEADFVVEAVTEDTP